MQRDEEVGLGEEGGEIGVGAPFLDGELLVKDLLELDRELSEAFEEKLRGILEAAVWRGQVSHGTGF
jgi:hypothetical protein